MALNELGKYEEAVTCFDKTLEFDQSVISWFNKGIALAGQGKYEEAIKYFDKVLSIEPENKDGKAKKEEMLKMMKNM